MMSKEKQIIEIKECIDSVYGADCAYYGVDGFAIANEIYNAGYRKQEWISVEERLPTAEEEDRGLVGIVNGHNGKIGFIDAIIFVNYDFEESEWWSSDYDLTNCKVEYWIPLPEAPKMKGGE